MSLLSVDFFLLLSPLLMEGVGGGEIKINSFFLNLMAVRVLGRIAQHDWVG